MWLPEQNFTYIAAMKPKMAFIIDIRRQNMIELLMYKSFFEMSETRADFLSKLFARKRPEGLSEKSTAAELFDAYSRVRPDPELYQQNLQSDEGPSRQDAQIRVEPADLDGAFSIEYVYSVFVDAGLSLDYSTGGRGAGVNNPTYADLMVIDDGTGAEAELPRNGRELPLSSRYGKEKPDHSPRRRFRRAENDSRGGASISGIVTPRSRPSIFRTSNSISSMTSRQTISTTMSRRCRWLPAAHSYVRSAEVVSAGALEADSSGLYRLCLQ